MEKYILKIQSGKWINIHRVESIECVQGDYFVMVGGHTFRVSPNYLPCFRAALEFRELEFTTQMGEAL